MRESGAPFGEARRLRYFVLISSELLEFPSVDMDLFIDKLVKAAKKINPELSNYVRETGILQSNAVARNYIRFADWLDFLRIENRIIIPNSYTVFLANLNGGKDFFLTEKEKIVFFLKLTDLNDFKNLLGSLKIENSIRDYIELLGSSEHFVESYFEWLVDFGLLKPTRRKFGLFNLTNLGYQVREAAKQHEQIFVKYVESLLGTSLSNTLWVPDDDIWNAMREAINKLGSYTQSEVDPMLYSAYPLVLDLQIRLILQNHTMVSITELVKKLIDISPNHNAIFDWDNIANAGYFKLQRY